MERKNKLIFAEAFFLALIIFILGLVLGMYLEQNRIDDLNQAFFNSEVSLYDSFALGKFLEGEECAVSERYLIDFANKIYEEARLLEKYDNSNKITDSAKAVHRKYDLLRTLLWGEAEFLKERCEGFNVVIYLYDYETKDLVKKSNQNVFSSVLIDLKDKHGDDIILIPIASDQGIVSLDYLIESKNIENIPAIIVNEEVFYGVESVSVLEKYLE